MRKLIRLILLHTGGGGRGHDQPMATQEAGGVNSQPLYQAPGQGYGGNRCDMYQKEFMKCLESANGDSSQCQGFWEAMKVSVSRLASLSFDMEFFLLLFTGMSTLSKSW